MRCDSLIIFFDLVKTENLHKLLKYNKQIEDEKKEFAQKLEQYFSTKLTKEEEKRLQNEVIKTVNKMIPIPSQETAIKYNKKIVENMTKEFYKDFMKMMNNISRSQAVYRQSKISQRDLQASQYAFVLAICRAPGRSQEELARELCLNKSTVARTLNGLEEKGYLTRTPLPHDRRQLAVYPTEKMLAVLPEVRKASEDWMRLLSDGIPEEELAVFNSVLERMQERARTIVEGQEENK